MNLIRTALPIAAVLLLVGCVEASSAAKQPSPRAEESANLWLYVSNQSFEDERIDIQVEIDGEVVVDDTFHVEGQHNWIEYPLDLPAGNHSLHAATDNGVSTTESLELPDGETRWAVLEYWYDADGSPRRFTFRVSDSAVGFD